MIAMIAAMAANRVIGRDGKIPWDLPEDRKYFRELTMGHVLVMGRRTWEEIGGSLPGRTTCLVSAAKKEQKDGILTARSVKEAVNLAQKTCPQKNIFLCGGTGIYREGMGLAERIYLTVLDCEIEGDTYFPEIGKEYRLLEERRGDGYSFTVYEISNKMKV